MAQLSHSFSQGSAKATVFAQQHTHNSPILERSMMKPFEQLCLHLSLQFIIIVSLHVPAMAENKFCLKANKSIDLQTITTPMEMSSFNRLLVQAVRKNKTSFLFMRAQTKNGADFWTNSQTLISSQGFHGRFQDQKAFQIFSSPNTSRIQWRKQFSLLRRGHSLILVIAKKPTTYTFQLAPMSECEEIIF